MIRFVLPIIFFIVAVASLMYDFKKSKNKLSQDQIIRYMGKNK